MKKQQKLQRIVVCSDQQSPYHDEKLWPLFIKFLMDFHPHHLILNGDFIDCYALSKYKRHPTLQRGRSFKEEVVEAKKLLQQLRRAVGSDCEMTYIFGNHSLRAEKYIADNAEEFVGLITLEDLLCLKQLNIKVVKNDLNENYIDYKGKVLIGHFDRFSSIPGGTARALVAKMGKSVIQGHTHKAAVISFSYHDGEVYGIESGCMANKQAVYAMHTDWSQGFTILWFDENDNWWFDQIFVKNSSFVACGKLYR